jgi:hypothetical protein
MNDDTPPRLTRDVVSKEGRTPAQVRRRRRDLLIALAWKSGASTALIADAFELSRARVEQILAKLAAEAAMIPEMRARLMENCPPAKLHRCRVRAIRWRHDDENCPPEAQ